MEKIHLNEDSHREFLSTHTNNLYSSISKNKQSSKKLAKDLNARFSTEVVEMAVEYKKRF